VRMTAINRCVNALCEARNLPAPLTESSACSVVNRCGRDRLWPLERVSNSSLVQLSEAQTESQRPTAKQHKAAKARQPTGIETCKQPASTHQMPLPVRQQAGRR
jgi:hypothetical protein